MEDKCIKTLLNLYLKSDGLIININIDNVNYYINVYVESNMNKQTERNQLDEIFRDINPLLPFPTPTRGWLRAIRESLGMPLRKLADRIGTSPQTIQQIEKREANESISIASLKRAAENLNCIFVYAIVPKRPLEESMRTFAEEAADTILKGATQTMDLEGQPVRAVPVETMREELIIELKNNPRLMWRWVK